jgi:UDP-glucose 4-epimerase
MPQALKPLEPNLSGKHRFGAVLRAARVGRGMSQADLAKLVHVHPDLIAKVEKAARWPTEALATSCDSALSTGGRLAALWPDVARERQEEKRPRPNSAANDAEDVHVFEPIGEGTTVVIGGRAVNGRRVIVTGGAGFIGTHATRELRKLGARVSVVDIEPRDATGAIEFDVCDPRLGSVFTDLMPEVVVHLAGQPRVVAALADPACDAHANVLGTINVVSAALKAGASRIVAASIGGTIYGDSRRDRRVAESDHRLPTSPYGLSKATADAYLAMLAPSSTVSLALGNVYGPGDTGVCGQFLSALRRGERNIGTGRATSINDLLKLITSALGIAADPIYVPRIEGEVSHNCLDVGRAHRMLGWRAEVDLADGIRRLVESPNNPGYASTGTRRLQ